MRAWTRFKRLRRRPSSGSCELDNEFTESIKGGNSLTSWETISFLRSSLIHGLGLWRVTGGDQEHIKVCAGKGDSNPRPFEPEPQVLRFNCQVRRDQQKRLSLLFIHYLLIHSATSIYLSTYLCLYTLLLGNAGEQPKSSALNRKRNHTISKFWSIH
jgi:hypothetical protein